MRIELLTHPNIPKPLHTLAPRTLLGEEWWNRVRQEAYAKENYHCWACGIHKYEADFHQWLEAHETYEINYAEGWMQLTEIVALCHSCHNFIHSGRLWILFKQGKITENKLRFILLHGFSLLKSQQLKPFWGTALIWHLLNGKSEAAAIQDLRERKILVEHDEVFAEWSRWRLILNGKEYRTPFKDIDDWARHFKEKGNE